MQLTIISGRSGSGKSTVLHVLEDLGYYCIDNLPASLLPALANRISEDGNDLPLVAVSIDARNVSEDLEKVPEILTELKNTQISTQILFLDANSKTLLRRFNESRRKHPLSTETIGLREAINFESDLLEHISLLASLTIDTSSMSLQTLRQTVKEQFLGNQSSATALLFQSFGFKHGVPVDADIVYDVRCSWAVRDMIGEAGGTALIERVGHSFIKPRMFEEGAVYAGELSGHYYFSDFFGADSGLVPALLMLEMLSRRSTKLSALLQPLESRYFLSSEINSRVEDPAQKIAAIAERYANGQIEHIDGISISYEDWHFNVRASNTEPLLRLNLEALDEQTMCDRRDEVLAFIRS